MVRAAVIVVLALATAACSKSDGPALRSHDEIEDIASDAAADAVADQSTRIDELEARVVELEDKLDN